MLNQLTIQNLTTVDQLDLELPAGLITITGETGAGKSVLLDSITLALGGRANKSNARSDKRNIDISANFISNNQDIIKWLDQRDLTEEDSNEILLRRVIKTDGKSKAYINGKPVNISTLKQLGEQLLDMHGQHEHQGLLKKENHQTLLDNYADHDPLLTEVARLHQRYQTIYREIKHLCDSSDGAEAQQQLLQYQLDELLALAPQAGEVESLQQELKLLSATSMIQADIQAALDVTEDDNSNALSLLNQAINRIEQHKAILKNLAPASEMLSSAAIQISEANSELRECLVGIESDPQRIQDIEQRLDQLFSAARKHQVNAEALPDKLADIERALKALESHAEDLEKLNADKADCLERFQKAAKKLSASRAKAAKKLSQAVCKQLAELEMSHCRFEIALHQVEDQQPRQRGNENAEFLVSTIPNKPAQPLSAVASGGELSRISLAIQVVTAKTTNTPTLVFDEVDVGIGGKTAGVVGRLLQEIGKDTQVLCVTHLAQVAAKGNAHLLVSKTIEKSNATTQVDFLDAKKRTNEIARMIGGVDITDSTIAHASEILETA